MNTYNRIYILGIIICFSVFSQRLVSQVSKIEKEALVTLYNATNGQNWSNTWNLNKPVSTWYGVKLKNDKVVELNLFNNNLVGSIPESISDIKHLTVLNMAFNSITGLLPKNMVDLSELKIFKVEMNRIKGGIPQAIGKMKSLVEFSAFNNFLTGPIPESFGRFFTYHLNISFYLIFIINNFRILYSI